MIVALLYTVLPIFASGCGKLWEYYRVFASVCSLVGSLMIFYKLWEYYREYKAIEVRVGHEFSNEYMPQFQIWYRGRKDYAVKWKMNVKFKIGNKIYNENEYHGDIDTLKKDKKRRNEFGSIPIYASFPHNVHFLFFLHTTLSLAVSLHQDTWRTHKLLDHILSYDKKEWTRFIKGITNGEAVVIIEGEGNIVTVGDRITCHAGGVGMNGIYVGGGMNIDQYNRKRIANRFQNHNDEVKKLFPRNERIFPSRRSKRDIRRALAR